ncbi:DUF1289 domain-containing protein [Aliiroseovarius marinus]|uniref:DUF1289 domain-containing protein n=1 Tax=Aliiroseovarius marinus TaxID=2500159 RepID=UPI00106000C7|nr:DUF1289 domain-containing protein [Aliiroseovarius marinus]
MTDDVWKRNEIASPCVKICVVHPEARICTGCYRTIEEIGGWSRMTDDQRARIMGELDARKSSLTKRRGGRRARLSQG